MATWRPLQMIAGVLTEVAAILSSAGAGDSGKIPALDATGKLDNSFMPVGIGAATITVTASEALAAGNFVNIWNDSGTAKTRKADATTAGKEANGFVLAAVDSAATATVYPPGALNTQLSALTPGTKYYLATTAGGVTATPPSSSGNVVQYLGTTDSATEMVFERGTPVTLA